MASTDKQRTALQVIFAFFLGLMVTAFIGVGVYTFYPPPEMKFDAQLQELYRQQSDIQNFKDNTQLTPADRAKLTQIEKQIRTLEDKQNAERETWGRNTSIVLIAFATLVMSVSLIRADELRVISNGLLLGGVFTMLYGTGWVIATGTSQARFWVMTVALVITLALGYLRFVRERSQIAVVSDTAAAGGAELGDLEARVAALEERVSVAAAALRGDEQS